MTVEAVLGLLVRFLVLTLVGLRLSWLLIEDELLGAPRSWLIERSQARGRARLAMFFACPFCIGFWAQALLVAVASFHLDLPLPVLWPLAINMVAAPLHLWLDARLPK